jgi:preprotein translocase subunit YajC
MEALILPLILVAMFALVIMPQRRQQKQQAALLASLAEGDAVLTSGGIYGVISEVDGNDLYLEVANGIELRVNKSAVLRKVGDPTESTEGK